MIKEITTWPGWETVRLLGSGSFGKVYEIRRETMGKTERAALKVIRIPREASELQSVLNEGMTEEEATAYFRGFVEDITDEFGLMSKLTGLSNIVTCHDCDVIEDADGIGWTILIRMELLTPILNRNAIQPFSEEEVIRMGIDICKALEICQENYIIHRDIKPENIFINSHGDYKLGDFGIARTMEKTMASMSQKGTETYMAPEVILGKRYGYTVDIYSLSTVLYRFLNNNRTPFLPQGTIRWEDRESAKNRKTDGETVPAPLNGTKKLKAVVLKGLAYEPEKRYSSAKEMRAALESCLLDYPKLVPRPILTREGPGIPIPDGPSPDGPTPDEDPTIGGNPFPDPPEPIGPGKGPEPPVPPEPKPKRKPIKWVILSGALLLTIIIAVKVITTTWKYNLEVISGDGGGAYRKGEQVILHANDADEGYHFDHWECDDEAGDEIDLQEETTVIRMPGKDLKVTAVYEVDVNQVTVNGGEGSGEYAYGDTVEIIADTGSENGQFLKWNTTSEHLKITDIASAHTSFIMPANDVEITAEYDEMFHLEIIKGDGGGTYRKGEQVVLHANDADEGYHFDHWECDDEAGDEIDLHEETTVIRMPGKDLKVTAVYEVDVNQVTVNGGEGSGEYAYGDTVEIIADTGSENGQFLKWNTTSEHLKITDIASAHTTFIMPANDVEITAEYEIDVVEDIETTPPQKQKEEKSVDNETTPDQSNGGNVGFEVVVDDIDPNSRDRSLQETRLAASDILLKYVLENDNLPPVIEEKVYGTWVSPDGGIWTLGADVVMTRDENKGGITPHVDGNILTWSGEDLDGKSYVLMFSEDYRHLFLINPNTKHCSLALSRMLNETTGVTLDRDLGDHEPRGAFDTLSSGRGFIHVAGWMFDPDTPSIPSSYIITIGGRMGIGTQYGPYTANVPRPGLDELFGVGLYHGFMRTIYTNMGGRQDIYIYTSDNDGGYIEMGYGSTEIEASNLIFGDDINRNDYS